jgi:lipopolysaccharide transport system permease protein
LSTHNPFSFLETGWKHRQLILRLTRRRIEAQYRGSMLGALWLVLQPLLILALYTFVFSALFKARWDLPGVAEPRFAVVLFSGLILYTLLTTCLNQAPRLLETHRSYIKQTLFPTEVLSWVVLAHALFDFLVGLVLLAALYFGMMGPPPLTSLLLPLVVAPILLAALGLTWFFSSLGVFLKDLSQLIGVMTLALLFLSPIFYPAAIVPERLQFYYRLNPLAGLLEMSRGLLFTGSLPDWVALTTLTALGWLVAWFGYLWFMKTKKGFADAL